MSEPSMDDHEYAGFWIRVGAALIDTLLMMLVFIPVLLAVYGWGYFGAGDRVQGPMDFLLNYVAPAVAVIAYWLVKQATPGKLALGMRIVDARTGGPMSPAQAVGRYIAYYVSIIPLCLGLFWVGWDGRKQGWHDKLAGTVVIRHKHGGTQAVRFDAKA